MIYKILGGILIISLLFSFAFSTTEKLSSSLLEGAQSAVTLVISIAGSLCLWSGLAEIMEQSGMVKAISIPFAPIIKMVFGKTAGDREFFENMVQNMAANFLGLGNLATPTGLKAAQRLHSLGERDKVIRLIVMNTASIQLTPSTLAGVRLAMGAASPFDILPCVIISSALSVVFGVGLCVILQRASGAK